MCRIEFLKEDFVCDSPSCGETPAYIVCDGQVVGPLRKRTEHLSEFDRHPTDNGALPQGSLFQDRVFISKAKERKKIR